MDDLLPAGPSPLSDHLRTEVDALAAMLPSPPAPRVRGALPDAPAPAPTARFEPPPVPAAWPGPDREGTGGPPASDRPTASGSSGTPYPRGTPVA